MVWGEGCSEPLISIKVTNQTMCKRTDHVILADS